MKNEYIAVDIGASSGRLIHCKTVDGKLNLTEIHRFKNQMVYNNNHYEWSVDKLYEEILVGLKKAADVCEKITSIGIDTWAVDYVLVDNKGKRVAPVYAYRDHRTDNTMDKVFESMSKEVIYNKTGIQFQQFNTLYQLFEHVKAYADDFAGEISLMMIPDYLGYKLSGVKAIEYTNATSTQLLDAQTKKWDQELLDFVGVKKEIFPTMVSPGTVLNDVLPEVVDKTGVLESLKVVAPATHDTGSAIVSVPALDSNYAYISSGTWSLMGIESDVPIISDLSGKYNFTNEGGVFDTIRVLKNIMGLWLIQEVARMYEDKYTFADFVVMAEKSEPFAFMIDPNDSRFINPDNMIEEIQAYCKGTGQKVPTEPGQIARTIFEGLAFLYKQVLEQLSEISNKTIERIHIIGGGCQNKLLNQMCADFTGLDVYSGPIEATAIGNIAMQMIAMGEVETLTEARQLIMNSFDIECFKTNHSETIEENYMKFRRLQNGTY